MNTSRSDKNEINSHSFWENNDENRWKVCQVIRRQFNSFFDDQNTVSTTEMNVTTYMLTSFEYSFLFGTHEIILIYKNIYCEAVRIKYIIIRFR